MKKQWCTLGCCWVNFLCNFFISLQKLLNSFSHVSLISLSLSLSQFDKNTKSYYHTSYHINTKHSFSKWKVIDSSYGFQRKVTFLNFLIFTPLFQVIIESGNESILWIWKLSRTIVHVYNCPLLKNFEIFLLSINTSKSW